MRKAAMAGLFACALICIASRSHASASSLDMVKDNIKPANTLTGSVIALAEPSSQTDVKPLPAIQPEPKVYEVKEGDTLSSIAADNQTTWVRLFNKNTQLATPDVINIGDKLTIPTPDEQLADRPLPAPVESSTIQHLVTAPAKPVARTAAVTASVHYAMGSTAGNTYTPGYCTWYAKNRRPDLPNDLGNAYTWVSRAAAEGFATGSAPRAGAIGQQGNHVVYIESVNGDGTVTTSEMNYAGLYVVSSRTVPASYFTYIY